MDSFFAPREKTPEDRKEHNDILPHPRSFTTMNGLSPTEVACDFSPKGFPSHLNADSFNVSTNADTDVALGGRLK
ncbi:MAG: hypothetical protein K2I08_01720 [Muribaculaceae bacterium]|nr:hypothetical protein [Muribaculaceae bacterium]